VAVVTVFLNPRPSIFSNHSFLLLTNLFAQIYSVQIRDLSSNAISGLPILQKARMPIHHFYLLAILCIAIFLCCISFVESKQSLFKDRSQKHAPKEGKSEKFFAQGSARSDGKSDPSLDSDIKLGEGLGEEDVITFKSEEDKRRKMERLAELRRSEAKKSSEKDIEELKREEFELRKNVMRAALNFGDLSVEKINAKHALGRNLFKQNRFDLIYDLSWDIVTDNEELHGVDDLEVAKALTNVGSVAWKLQKGDIARLVSLRMLGIYQGHDFDDKDAEEKAVLTARARLMSYQQEGGDVMSGISHKEFQERLAKLKSAEATENPAKNQDL
jgi:hypothetical protein